MKHALTVVAVTWLIATNPISSSATLAAASQQVDQDVTQLLASPKLAVTARLKTLRMDATVRDILTFIADATGIKVSYDRNLPQLDRKSSISLTDVTLEEALNAPLGQNGLAFLVSSPTLVFIFEDTPQNRQRFSVSIQVFNLKYADPQHIFQLIGERVLSDSNGVRPFVQADKEKRTISVRATADKMALIAQLIADNDKR